MQRVVVIAVAAALALSACAGTKRSPIKSGTGPGTVTPAPQPSGTAPMQDDVGLPEQRIQLPKDDHVVELIVPGDVRVGVREMLTISARGAGEFRLVPEGPNALTLSAPAELGVEKPVQKRADASVLSAELVSYQVWFTATKAGKFEVTGELAVPTCSETICHPRKDALAFSIVVR